MQSTDIRKVGMLRSGNVYRWYILQNGDNEEADYVPQFSLGSAHGSVGIAMWSDDLELILYDDCLFLAVL